MLLQPKSHEFNLRLLISDDLLRQPAYLAISAILQLGPGHVNRRLMMRKHQPDNQHRCCQTALLIPWRHAFFPCSPSVRPNPFPERRQRCVDESIALEPTMQRQRSGIPESQQSKCFFSLRTSACRRCAARPWESAFAYLARAVLPSILLTQRDGGLGCEQQEGERLLQIQANNGISVA